MSDSFWEIPGRFHLLTPVGNPPGVEEFKRQFDQAWQAIPQGQKEAILAHWNSRMPVTQVIYETAEFFKGPYRPAFYDEDSIKFFFLAEAFFHFPCQGWRAEMIAHELAHACLFALRRDAHAKPWPRASPEECARVGSEREQEVEALLSEWGYPASYLHECFAWCQETDYGTNPEAVTRWNERQARQ